MEYLLTASRCLGIYGSCPLPVSREVTVFIPIYKIILYSLPVILFYALMWRWQVLVDLSPETPGPDGLIPAPDANDPKIKREFRVAIALGTSIYGFLLIAILLNRFYPHL